MRNKRVPRNVDILERTFHWAMKDISKIDKNPVRFLDSSEFSMGENDELTWCLQMFPNDVPFSKHKGFISIFCILKSIDMSTLVRAKVSISLKNSRNKKSQELSKTCIFKKNTHTGPYNFSIKSNSYGKNLNDLTITCKISAEILNHTNPNDLSEDFRRLIENPERSDLTIIAYGEEIHAHKVILSARSQIFSAIFRDNMKDKKTSILKIDDVENDLELSAFKQMIRFIYTDKVENLRTLAIPLLKFSEKYGIDKLKEISEDSLCRNITLINASDYLIMADNFQASKLKTVVIDYIINNAVSVVRTSGFKMMERLHPYLVAEIFRVLVSKI